MATSIATTVMTTFAFPLVIICGLYIHSFIQDKMAIGAILSENFLFCILGFVFITERQQDKSKSTASLGNLIPHHYGVIHLPKVLEIAH